MTTNSMTTPSRLQRASTPTSEATSADTWTPRGLVSTIQDRPSDSSPTRGASRASFGGMLPNRSHADSNALGKLLPAQVRELREGFQILDRDSDGQIGREDVADMLTQLGTCKICSHAF
jgi:hypothetical protein